MFNYFEEKVTDLFYFELATCHNSNYDLMLPHIGLFHTM